MDVIPTDVKLAAYAFDEKGTLIGTAGVNREGSFNIALELKKPEAVEVLIAKSGDPEKARKASLDGRRYEVADWRDNILRPEIFVSKDIWWPWWPKRICISGQVRKVPGNCPVPYVKVEIFDVDRLFCLWPYIYPLREMLKKVSVAKIEELLRVQPEPGPGPFPEKIQTPVIPLPQPAPDFSEHAGLTNEMAVLGPQPEPPDRPQKNIKTCHSSPLG
jgi:hypothetical protein